MEQPAVGQQQVWNRLVSELPFSFIDRDDKEDRTFWFEMNEELWKTATFQVPPKRHRGKEVAR